MYYKVSKKEMCQLALNSLKKILKRKKSISDLLDASSRTCCGWPLNFFVIDECKNDITRFVSITRVNAIIFILLITAAFASTVVVFITLPSSLSLLSLSDKGSFSASSQFLSILFVADQFLQDSFGEASVWLDISLV